MSRIKVHIIDDSATVRKVISELLATDSSIDVIAASSDPVIACRKLEKEWPDVFILDIEMPRKDGLTFLKEIMSSRPTPVVICSSLTEKGAGITMQALSAGAVEIITKPKVGIKDFLYESAITLVDTVKSASLANVSKLNLAPDRKLSADAVLPLSANKRISDGRSKIIAIGASAGGTQAVEKILKTLPEDTPGIVIVQHMPEKFTRAYANRLDSVCRIHVKEAENNDDIIQGRALIAPGNHHLMICQKNGSYKAIVKDGPLVSRHRPSVDVLFRSVAQEAGSNAMGIILTGMGDDGASGMLEMHKAGVLTIAQNRETSVVFGMPREAIKKGGVDEILPLDEMSGRIINF